MTQAISRRAFVRRTALAAAAVSAAPWQVAGWRAPAALRIGVLSSSLASDATATRTLGIQLGVDEARHAAALFGGSLDLVPATLTSLRERTLSAVLGGDDLEACLMLMRAADAAGIGFMNIGCSDDSVRGAGCRATTFHIIPSDAMYRDALEQSKPAGGAQATAWDASLARFGADTLNQRFRAQFNQPMTADAWLGWLAVKILWESSLRARSTDARMLMQYMVRDGVQFDGHKGRPLSFRSWDHQLRQPVYVIDGNAAAPRRSIREMPPADAGGETSRDALDRLGTAEARSACRMPP